MRTVHRQLGTRVGASVAALGLLFTLLASAQRPPKPEQVVEVRVEPASLELRAGQAASFTLVATIREGFHVNSNKPLDEYLIPSRVELGGADQFELGKVDFPPAELKAFSFAPDEKLSVYEGTLRLPAELRAKDGAQAGTHTLRVALHYQACNDEICLRPAKREATLILRVR